MNKSAIVRSTANYVKRKMSLESTGHDWWHVYRVWRNALEIAKYEKGADLFVVQLAALLHDIADWKFNNGNEEKGARIAREWLERSGVGENTAAQVVDIVRNISFKGAKARSNAMSKEGEIVQDADRLDAIGAIGIARAFAYGGYMGRPIYDPQVKPRLHRSFAAYKSARSTTINHFYEKLLRLKGKMNTERGRKMAQKRDAFTRDYLKVFFGEWEGKH